MLISSNLYFLGASSCCSTQVTGNSSLFFSKKSFPLRGRAFKYGYAHYLEFPGAPLREDSYWYRVPRVFAVVSSLAELLWIKRSIVSVRVEIWAGNVSRLALILSSIKSGENLTLFSSFPSFVFTFTSLVTSSSCADISSCAFKSYEFPPLNVLNL